MQLIVYVSITVYAELSIGNKALTICEIVHDGLGQSKSTDFIRMPLPRVINAYTASATLLIAQSSAPGGASWTVLTCSDICGFAIATWDFWVKHVQASECFSTCPCGKPA